MSARTEGLWPTCDELCEHDFICRLGQLGIVGYSFNSKAEASKYDDVVYALTVGGTCASFEHRIRSLQYLLQDLDKEIPIDQFPYDLRVMIESWRDSAFVKLTSISDLLLEITVAVYELPLSEQEATFNNVQKALPNNHIKSPLGKITASKREFRKVRNRLVHGNGWFDPDGYGHAFEMASNFRGWGQGLIIKDIESSSKDMPIQTIFDNRRLHILDEAMAEFSELVPSFHLCLDLLSGEFEKRFRDKCSREASFMFKQKVPTQKST